MATFQVPQFIDQKPKIVGPLTLKQFFYLAGAAALGFASFKIFNFFLFLLIAAILAAFGVALAFVKVNGQEMSKVISSAIKFYLEPRIYTWQRIIKQETTTIDIGEIEEERDKMGLQDKLKSLALNITTGKLFSAAQFRKGRGQENGFEVATFSTGEKRVVKKVNY